MSAPQISHFTQNLKTHSFLLYLDLWFFLPFPIYPFPIYYYLGRYYENQFNLQVKLFHCTFSLINIFNKVSVFILTNLFLFFWPSGTIRHGGLHLMMSCQRDLNKFTIGLVLWLQHLTSYFIENCHCVISSD